MPPVRWAVAVRALVIGLGVCGVLVAWYAVVAKAAHDCLAGAHGVPNAAGAGITTEGCLVDTKTGGPVLVALPFGPPFEVAVIAVGAGVLLFIALLVVLGYVVYRGAGAGGSSGEPVGRG